MPLPGHVKTISVIIVCQTHDGNETKTYELHKDGDNSWKVGGPIFPRHVRLMQQIDSFFKYSEK